MFIWTRNVFLGWVSQLYLITILAVTLFISLKAHDLYSFQVKSNWKERSRNLMNGLQPLLCTQSSIHRIQLVKIQSLTPRHEYNLLGPQHQKLHSIDLHYSVVLLASVDKSRGGGVKKCSSLFCSSSFFLLPLPQPWIFNGMNSNFGTPEKEGGNM